MESKVDMEQIVLRAKQGDREALEKLYKLTCRFAYFHAKSLTKDEDAAWDLVQETYMAAYQSLDTLRDNNLFQPWLSGILYRIGYKKMRKKTEVLLTEEESDLFQDMIEQDEDRMPDRALDRKETVRIVREIIEQLPELQKAAVIAYYVDEMSVASIAKVAGCSEGTIKSRLNYARKAMKELIIRKEKEMGCCIHGLSAPIIVVALHEMFRQMSVSPIHATASWNTIAANLGIVSSVAGVGSAAAGAGKITADTGGAAAGTAKAAAGSAAAGAKTSAAAKGMVAVKGVLGVKATTVVTAVAIAGGTITAGAVTTAVYLQKQKEPVTVEVVQPSGETCQPDFEIEEDMENTQFQRGWEESADGWRYREADGSYVSGTWKEIDGEAYYFRKNDIMQTGELRLGNRIFTFDDNGTLCEIDYVNHHRRADDTVDTDYYEEDVCYSARRDGVYVRQLDGSGERKLSSQPGNLVAAENGVIYVYDDGHRQLCRMNEDGSALSFYSESEWLYGQELLAVDGTAYLNWSDWTHEELDIESIGGELLAVNMNDQSGKMKSQALVYTSGGDYLPMQQGIQAEGDWIYFYNQSRPHLDTQRTMSGIFRVRKDGSVRQRLVSGANPYFFVHGDLIYYSERGESDTLKKASVSACAARYQNAESQFASNPKEFYKNYVREELVPVYGTVTHLNGRIENTLKFESEEYGIISRKQTENEKETVGNGILGIYVEDLNQDGKQELAVFRTLRELNEASGWVGEWSVMDVYRFRDGIVTLADSKKLGRLTDNYSMDRAFFLAVKKGAKGPVFWLREENNYAHNYYFEVDELFRWTDDGFSMLVRTTNGSGEIYTCELEDGRYFEGHSSWGGFPNDEEIRSEIQRILQKYGFTSTEMTLDQEPNKQMLIQSFMGLAATETGCNEEQTWKIAEEISANGNLNAYPIYWYIRCEMTPTSIGGE